LLDSSFGFCPKYVCKNVLTRELLDILSIF
jgi:hypothetical protein